MGIANLSLITVKNHNLVRRWLPPLIGGVAALTLISWFYRDLDFGRFLTGLREAHPGWITLLAIAIVLEQVANGWKWRQILHDVKPVPTLRLTGALLAGYGANVLVPLGISPLVRSWLIARMEDLKMGTVLTTTIIARFIDGVMFALFAGLVAMEGKVPQIGGNLELGLAAAGAVNFVLFGTALWAMSRFRALFAREGPLICRLFDWIAQWFRSNGAALRSALRRRGLAAQTTAPVERIAGCRCGQADLGQSLRLGRTCRGRGARALRLSVPDGLRRIFTGAVAVYPGTRRLCHRVRTGVRSTWSARGTSPSDDPVQLDDVDHPRHGRRADRPLAIRNRHPAGATGSRGRRCQRLTPLFCAASGGVFGMWQVQRPRSRQGQQPWTVQP